MVMTFSSINICKSLSESVHRGSDPLKMCSLILANVSVSPSVGEHRGDSCIELYYIYSVLLFSNAYNIFFAFLSKTRNESEIEFKK